MECQGLEPRGFDSLGSFHLLLYKRFLWEHKAGCQPKLGSERWSLMAFDSQFRDRDKACNRKPVRQILRTSQAWLHNRVAGKKSDQQEQRKGPWTSAPSCHLQDDPLLSGAALRGSTDPHPKSGAR